MPFAMVVGPQSVPDGAGVDDDNSGDDDVGVTKQSRACDSCHRMKMRCINKENPPCNRCRQFGEACTFDAPRKRKPKKLENRMEMVEAHLRTFQSSLNEIIQLQRSGAAGVSNAVLTDGYPHASDPGDISDARPLPSTVSSTTTAYISQPSVVSPTPKYHNHAPILGESIPFNGIDLAHIAQHGGSADRAYSPVEQSFRSRHSSSPPIAPEIRTDDQLEPIEAAIAKGPWRSMLSLAQTARLEADGHSGNDSESMRRKRRSTQSPEYVMSFTDHQPLRKRARPSMSSETSRHDRGQEKARAFDMLDPVDMGFCSETRGKELYNSFMANSMFYIPVFDPKVDTWESLRERSPFCIAVILMIAQKCEDGAGLASELQMRCKECAEKMGMSSLFTPIASVEVVQALSWGDTSWRPGGHALRIGIELGLFRCLPYLNQNDMGTGKNAEDLVKEKSLVVGARVWLTLFETECQLAMSAGRPTIFVNTDSIKGARRFLNHPLSIPTDSRLVHFCELQAIRIPLYDPLTTLSSDAIPNLDGKLQEAGDALDEWTSYWDGYYASRGYSSSDIFRESLITMKSATVLYTNSLILHGVRNKRDIANLSRSRHRLLLKAIQAVDYFTYMACRSTQWTARIRYGNSFTHFNVAFHARFMIRIASLMPETVDLAQVGRNVEALADVLASVPGFPFASLLRNVLVEARRQRILPPASRPASPPPRLASSSQQYGILPHQNLDLAAPASQAHASLGIGDLDFLYADQLLKDLGTYGTNLFDAETSNVGSTNDQTFIFDAWNPFPPLDVHTGPSGADMQGNTAAGFDFSSGLGNWTV